MSSSLFNRRSVTGLLAAGLLASVSAGAVFAQQNLRHKTRKEPFRSILLSIVVLHIGVVVSLIIMPDWPFRLAGWMQA